jgi:hypothetical protein
VETVDFRVVVDVLGEGEGEQLFEEKVHGWGEVFSELAVLLGVLEGRLNLVGKGSNNGHDEGLSNFF